MTFRASFVQDLQQVMNQNIGICLIRLSLILFKA